MPMPTDRRAFLGVAARLAGAAAVGGVAPSPIAAVATSPGSERADRRFPPGFRWGLATAAYQVEGAPDADGKGRSIWDTYVHTEGKTRNGDTGDVANDHYHRYRRDVALMKDLGVDAYRFSVSWPRVFPEGRGRANPKGLGFYERLVDALLRAGIEPFATLYHWDLPQALQDRHGGWQSRETAEAFGEYAGHVARVLGDRVRHFVTTNELRSFVDLGYGGGGGSVQGRPTRLELAPGLTLPPATLNQARHHAVLGHGLAVQAIRASGRPGTRVGPAEAIAVAIPAIDTPDHVRAAEAATRDLNAPFLGVILDGRYDERYLAAAGRDAPRYTEADLQVIGASLDFVGINVYEPSLFVLASGRRPGYREVAIRESHPRMQASRHVFSPEVLYWAPTLLTSIWHPPEILVTEYGCAASDEPKDDGLVLDPDRVTYLRNALLQLHRAVAEGAPVRGGFVRSAMDTFEWTDGFGARYGLIHVDFRTQARTPKLSARWYREAARRNAVV